MSTITSQARTILALSGLPKSQTSPTRIKGAPLHSRGFTVRKNGDTQAVITWHPGYGRTCDHPDVAESLDAATQALEAYPQVRLRVTSRHLNTLTVEAVAEAQDAPAPVHSIEFLSSFEFASAWDDLRVKSGKSRLTGVTLELSRVQGAWATFARGSKADLRDASSSLDRAPVPGRFRLTVTV